MSDNDFDRLLETERYDEAWGRLAELTRTARSYHELVAVSRKRGRLAAVSSPGFDRTVSLAVLGGASTELLEEPLRLAIEERGLGCDIHHAAFNTFAAEMLDPASGTSAFAPDVALVVCTHANIPVWPELGDSSDEVERIVTEGADYWLTLAAKLHENTGCDVILSNFHLLPNRPFGNLGPKLPSDPNTFLRRLNLRLAEDAPAYVHINDIDTLAAQHGVSNWFDHRFWYHARQPVSFACLPHFVRNVSHIVGAIAGRTAKCLVVDLDNTLWGGVVGDDGPERILIGEGDPVGEAHKAFQQYLKRLHERGILLAVASKNDEDKALAAFELQPEMVLKREDFACFKANWQPKAQSAEEIARELNIGIDALVFVDDNPAERAQMRQFQPAVKVVELPPDPSDYIAAIEATGWFETIALGDEDQKRNRFYQENETRRNFQSATADYDTYLKSLEQRATIGPFQPQHLDRITQLINKTNQFNLTTKRLTRSEVETLMTSPDWLTAWMQVSDRFGDNGLVSVFAARRSGEDLEVDLWLMSCRVLQRQVEHALCNYVVACARGMSKRTIRGVYRPTDRNGLARDHYAAMGFTEIVPAENGSAGAPRELWQLDVGAFEAFDVPILIQDVDHV